MVGGDSAESVRGLIRAASEEWSNLNIPVDVRNFNVL